MQPELDANDMEDPVADDTLLEVMHWLGFGDDGVAYFRVLQEEEGKILVEQRTRRLT